jgi:predicted metal-dependent phosphoesterase TrpH
MHCLDGSRRFDLHMHSTRSDGAFAPEAVIEAAARGGLDVVAITDHDLATDFTFGPRSVGGRQLVVLPGAEISGTHEGVEYHLLVYFPHDVPRAFHEFCQQRCRERAARFDAGVASIGLTDLPSADELALEGKRSLTRHHLAQALIDKGHAKNIHDAFQRFAGDRVGHVPQVSLSFVEAIRVAREAGGVTSWAHPPVEAMRRHLGTFVAAGLHAVEGHRPNISSADRKKTKNLAKQHGIFLTGGSDWHGWHDKDLGLFHVERVDLQPFLAALAAVA